MIVSSIVLKQFNSFCLKELMYLQIRIYNHDIFAAWWRRSLIYFLIMLLDLIKVFLKKFDYANFVFTYLTNLFY